MKGEYDDILHAHRPEPLHARQTVDNRAKQFMPFDALRGFSLAILTQEARRELLPRVELTADAQERLERKLALLQPGDRVTARFFRPEGVIGGAELGNYLTETATVLAVDGETRTLELTAGVVPLGDLLDLQGEVFDLLEWEGA